MSNFIVLVKQVPDVTKISDNCFSPDTGTLIRAKLPSVINDLDTQALSLAAQMRRLAGEGKLVLLTMGPPMADDVLRFGLRRGADAAVLLTDKAFGGADTVATANPLAAAIRRIAADMFGGSRDFFVICGMQSVDGDTAQVPPQIAEDLGVTCLTYITAVDKNESGFVFTRIVSGGSQVAAPRRLPAVLTVAKYELPLFPSFSASRRALRADIVKLGKDDVKAKYLGLDGSKTSVFKVFQPDKSLRKCQEIKDPLELAVKIEESFRAADPSTTHPQIRSQYLLPSKRQSVWDHRFEALPRDWESFDFLQGLLKRMGLSCDKEFDDKEKDEIVAKSEKHFSRKQLDDVLKNLRLGSPSFPGEIWVMAEHDRGRVSGATFELLGKAHELSNALEVPAAAILVGDNVRHLEPELFQGGADKVYAARHPLLEHFDPLPWRKVVADAVVRHRPSILLFSATALGRTLAPLVSFRTGNGLTADCTGLDIRDFSFKNQVALLFQTRPALGGNIMATIYTKNSTTQMATARPGVFKRIAPDPSRTGETVQLPVDIDEKELSWRILSTEVAKTSANFHAEVIVSGGKGVRSKPNYQQMTATLVSALSKRLGAPVEKGASRAAVEHGFVERAYQVGQTGTAVSPKIYLALGISGAIQHMIGIANTRTIFAVNSDPHAPIFKQCDYYYVGNVEEVVPLLVKALGGA